MRRIITAITLFFLNFCIYAQKLPLVEAFRDAVFGQEVSISDAINLYQNANKEAREILTDFALNAALSRNEYLLGRVYQDNNQNDAAISRFEAGVSFAEQSIREKPNAHAYEMMATNIGHLCMLKSTSWVMSNGLKVEENAKKALQLDKNNAGAMYMIASRWAFGPGVFGNPKRGITELQAILDSNANLQKDEYFNVYSSMAYAHHRLNQNKEALPLITQALLLYPTNKFALDLNSKILQKLGNTR